jgi:hypothetical protein
MSKTIAPAMMANTSHRPTANHRSPEGAPKYAATGVAKRIPIRVDLVLLSLIGSLLPNRGTTLRFVMPGDNQFPTTR